MPSSVRWAAGEPFTAEASGPDSVVMEVVEGHKLKSLSLHFINYEPKAKGRLNVKMYLSPRLKSARARLLAPAKAGGKDYTPPAPKPLKVAMYKGTARFSLPAPEVYACVVVEC